MQVSPEAVLRRRADFCRGSGWTRSRHTNGQSFDAARSQEKSSEKGWHGSYKTLEIGYSSIEMGAAGRCSSQSSCSTLRSLARPLSHNKQTHGSRVPLCSSSTSVVGPPISTVCGKCSCTVLRPVTLTLDVRSCYVRKTLLSAVIP